MFSQYSLENKVVEIVAFKQEINKLIDDYLENESLQTAPGTNSPITESEDDQTIKDKKLLEQVIIYYNRMKKFFNAVTDSDNDDDIDSNDFVDESDNDSYNSQKTTINGNDYLEPITQYDENSFEDVLSDDDMYQSKHKYYEHSNNLYNVINKKILGLADETNENNETISNNFIEERSVDPILYNSPKEKFNNANASQSTYQETIPIFKDHWMDRHSDRGYKELIPPAQWSYRENQEQTPRTQYFFRNYETDESQEKKMKESDDEYDPTDTDYKNHNTKNVFNYDEKEVCFVLSNDNINYEEPIFQEITESIEEKNIIEQSSGPIFWDFSNKNKASETQSKLVPQCEEA